MTYKAVDVYALNTVDYYALSASGVTHAWVKLSEGTDVDGKAAEHIKRFKDVGIKCGGYAYEYSPREYQAEAAKTFCERLWAAGASELRPVVDFESACSASRKVCVPPEVALRHCESLAMEIEKILSAEVMVYTGPGFWDSIPNSGSSWLCERSVWVADYRGKLVDEWTPLRGAAPPSGFSAVSMHQFTDGKTHGLKALDRSIIHDIDAVTWLDVVGAD